MLRKDEAGTKTRPAKPAEHKPGTPRPHRTGSGQLEATTAKAAMRASLRRSLLFGPGDCRRPPRRQLECALVADAKIRQFSHRSTSAFI
jgi:hypothetical protein